ncbi:MAG: GGDEF domain-containing protein [Pseudoxanthomonas sp.]
MAWSFDLRSATVFGAVCVLLVATLLLLGWRSLPGAMLPSLRWWLASLGLHGAGSLLMATRDLASTWLSLVLANTLLGMGLACMAIAMRGFYGIPQRRTLHIGLALSIALVALWFVEIHPDVHARIVSLSLLLAVPMASAARSVFRRGGPMGVVPRLTGIAFAFGTSTLLVRAAAELVWPSEALQLMEPLPMNVACVGAVLVLPLLATVGFLLMCTERSQAELERTARLDYLTGIYNRRAIEELASREIRAARRHGNALAILLLDVDHFKRVNDEHGHEVGDQALIEAVRRMRKSLRGEDLIGRQGGEEFVVVMPGQDLDSAHAAAERLRRDFADDAMRVIAGGTPIESLVTVSIGVAALCVGDAHWSNLLRRADRAMYAAKAAGRNTVVADLDHA